MQFIPRGALNNIPAFVQIMARRRSGGKPLSEQMMAKFNEAYMSHSATIELKALKFENMRI